MQSCVCRVFVVALFVGGLLAQVQRYELGLRLRQFERHLETVEQRDLREAAFTELDGAVQAFFRLDTKSVAKAIDTADCALHGNDWSVAKRYAHSLQWALDARLLAIGSATVTGKLSQAYRIDDEDYEPGVCSLVIRVPGIAKAIVMPVTELPQVITLPVTGIPAGDHTLKWSIVQGDEVLVEREQPLSVVADLAPRLARLAVAAKVAKSQEPATVESKTLPALSSMLQGMQRRRPAETVLFGYEMLAEAEALAAWLAKPGEQKAFYGAHRAGSFHLRIPVGKRTIAVRLLVPKTEGTVPLVMALHGAGGSENLFFDGYGDGRVVALAGERGWMVVAPRLGLGAIDCASLVDALARRFPVDSERVLMVGHSMGAMQAVANAVRAPQRYRAVAALGGGGRVRRNAALKDLPFYVGVGTKDFARKGANALHQALLGAGSPSRLQEFAGVEHLAIVQVALAEVFGFFDESLRR
tara:strand:+ start:28 stop:1437 length:1410 start_codon:yes stop_codon:yes gene_type:complete